jgi:nucleoid DNA-binding protein
MAKAKAAAKKNMTKSGLIQTITDILGESTSRKQVKATLDALQEVGHKELKKNSIFVLPGFAKFVVVKKPARPARQGINPFTKQPMTFAAKPASKAVKARPVKAIKMAVG